MTAELFQALKEYKLPRLVYKIVSDDKIIEVIADSDLSFQSSYKNLALALLQEQEEMFNSASELEMSMRVPYIIAYSS